MKCKSRCISILDTCDVDNQALIVLLSTFLVLIVIMLVICWSYILLLCISKRKEIVSRQDGSNNDLLNWQNRRRRRQERVRRITPCPPINNQRSSGVDSEGAEGARASPELEGSEEKQSLISTYWSLAITASTSGFEKLSTAL